MYFTSQLAKTGSCWEGDHVSTPCSSYHQGQEASVRDQGCTETLTRRIWYAMYANGLTMSTYRVILGLGAGDAILLVRLLVVVKPAVPIMVGLLKL